MQIAVEAMKGEIARGWNFMSLVITGGCRRGVLSGWASVVSELFGERIHDGGQAGEGPYLAAP